MIVIAVPRAMRIVAILPLDAQRARVVDFEPLRDVVDPAAMQTVPPTSFTSLMASWIVRLPDECDSGVTQTEQSQLSPPSVGSGGQSGGSSWRCSAA